MGSRLDIDLQLQPARSQAARFERDDVGLRRRRLVLCPGLLGQGPIALALGPDLEGAACT